MREIEFRAWLKDEKKIIDVISIDFRIKEIAYEEQCTLANIQQTWYEYRDFDEIELMQYTGLKDKNGVEIYEGDILKYPDNDEKDCIGVVEYGHFNCSCCHAVFVFTTINYKGWEFDMLVNDKEQAPLYEVIGNIYENKELMKVKEDE